MKQISGFVLHLLVQSSIIFVQTGVGIYFIYLFQQMKTITYSFNYQIQNKFNI